MSKSDEIRNKVLGRIKGLSDTMTDSLGHIAKGKNVFCPQNIVNKRLAICKSCPEFIQTTTQCRKCGCFMSAKTRLKTASCPIAKWTKETL